MKDIETAAKALLSFAPSDEVKTCEMMAPYTTFRIGGPADIAFFPRTKEEAVRAITLFPDALVIGAGSNTLISDRGVRGLVVILGKNMRGITSSGSRIECLSGTPLPALSAFAADCALSGLEFASGIPGSAGGAAAMNAGAYGGEISQILSSCDILENNSVRTFDVSQMEYGYRLSRVLRYGGTVLSCIFSLTHDDPEAIRARIRDYSARRREKQPLSYPSAGSFYKRPEGHFAGKLIEDAGLKGLTVGGAQISELHAGFVINTGHATCADVLALSDIVEKTVYDRFGVRLEKEVRLAGEF